ncbi:hypothetical protein NE237_003295 [Protea cynaroides]|uniref:Wax synthase domain-containing protein n=1 Tax=Protea cynaroides TaxID=273540 RepID=A0A9Q0KGS6_9MAGN|nr:hypothetical protein NE237_003295 [Protea cynaroides]
MEGDLKNIIKVWVSVFASLSYCYLIASRIPEGNFKLLSLIPIFCLFLFLPLTLSSFHLRGFTAFFLAWLANFRLFLAWLAFFLLSLDPSMPLLRFIFCQRENPSPLPTRKTPNSPLVYAIKVKLFAVVIRSYKYRQYVHPHIQMILYGNHIYFGMEVFLGMPTFKEPHLSTSLQDFWGQRWNLMVTKIMHPTVYESESVPQMVAILNTFLVSGLMHELMFFYIGCWQPSWKTMFYFALRGVTLAAEVAAKKALASRWQLHPAVSWTLTNGFVFVTISWLLISQFLRCQLDIKAISEYNAFLGFIKNVGGFGVCHVPQ